MRPLNLLPAFVAIALAPALSHARETYTGAARTDFGAESRDGQFELKVDGSKISGRVFSPVLSHGFRVRGTVDKAGRFSLRAIRDAVNGRITGTVRAGTLQGKGRWRSSRQPAAFVTLKGQMRAPIRYDPYNYDFSGIYICTPDNWDAVLYSWAQVTIKDNQYSIVLAGKGEGDRWDQLDGALKDDSEHFVAERSAVIDYEYIIYHTVFDSRAPMRAYLSLIQPRNSAGTPKVRVTVTTDGWAFIVPDRRLPGESNYGNW